MKVGVESKLKIQGHTELVLQVQSQKPEGVSQPATEV